MTDVVFLISVIAFSINSLEVFAISNPKPYSSVISLAADWLLPASLLISDATTAKPFPCSLALAASTAAFNLPSRMLRQTRRFGLPWLRQASLTAVRQVSLMLASETRVGDTLSGTPCPGLALGLNIIYFIKTIGLASGCIIIIPKIQSYQGS